VLEKIDVTLLKQNSVKIKDGIRKYTSIMNRLHECDVSQDREFQKSFNHFYRVRQKSTEWYQLYYSYMQKHKSGEIAFEDVLFYLHERTGKYESSFSSKLLATVNPDMPVWDMNVLSQLSLNAPPSYCKDRLKKIVEVYSALQKWYADYLKTQNAQEVITRFDELFSETNLTDLKKIDLALWSMGVKK
jgi:hypothetical protein